MQKDLETEFDLERTALKKQLKSRTCKNSDYKRVKDKLFAKV